MISDSDETLRDTIKNEIGLIAWKELARFFAGGHAVAIDAKLDLAEVAFQFSKYNKIAEEHLMNQGKVIKVSDEQAQTWFAADATVAAIVVNPWVLVQAVETRH